LFSCQDWVYDTVEEGVTFAKRFERIVCPRVQEAGVDYIIAVPTEFVQQRYILDELYGKYTNDGYEGQMIRLNERYENKRSKNLLKRKEFQDKEYTILDIIEGDGNRAGGAGAMVFENEQGVRFNSNIKGTREYCTQLLREKDSVIGKQATVKFFNLTPDSLVPRFPFVIAVRDYE
jgi:DNA ligase-1